MLNFIIINKLYYVAAPYHCQLMTSCECDQENPCAYFLPEYALARLVWSEEKCYCIFFSSFRFSQMIQTPKMFLKSLPFLSHAVLAVLLSLPCNVNMWFLLELSKGTSWYILHLLLMVCVPQEWIFQHSHYSASTRVCIPNSTAWFRDGLREFTHEITSTVSTKIAWTAAA